MFGRRILILLTVVALGGGLSAWGVPKGSAKRELQELVRSPRMEFPVPLEFHRRFGFVTFPEESFAAAEAARFTRAHGETTRNGVDEAERLLRTAQIHDAQGDVSGALRHYSRAADGFRKRLEVSPEEVRSLVGLGEALSSLGRFSEAQSILERAGDVGDVDLWLARMKLYRERAWFAVAGEAARYATSTFLEQLVQMVAFSPEPVRVEESKRFLRLAGDAVERAFEVETSKLNAAERLLDRAAFRSFQNAMEVAYEQVQGQELKSRLLRASIFTEPALHDLITAAERSDDPALMASSALAASMAGEMMANWTSQGAGGEVYVRHAATRLRRIMEERDERASAAAEYLGALQLHTLRDARGAERSFRQALGLESGRNRSWELLTVAAVQQGDEELVELTEERVRALPQPRSAVLQVKAYERSGDNLRAAWVALNAAGTYPNDPLVNLTLAAMLLKDENAEMFLWRVEEALKKAEKAFGTTAKRQQRLDFVLVKSVYLGMAGKEDEAKRLVEGAKPLTPELQELLRVLGE
jgi:tetratricopeptide (TPR) repeat protein